MVCIAPHTRYVTPARWLHWTIFALVALAYVFINLFELFPRGSATRNNVLASHYTMGLAVLLLVLPRLLVRVRNGRPPISPAPPRWSEWLGNLTHLALYLFLLIQPLLGIITLQVGAKPVSLFGVTLLPALVDTPNRWLSHQLERIHMTLGTVFYYVIGLHIAAALWHHLVRRDDTLRRML
jgi:cytochrome b561